MKDEIRNILLGMDLSDGDDWTETIGALSDLFSERVAAAQQRIAVLEDACNAALTIHDRYCDRVGASESWARSVHEKLRTAYLFRTEGQMTAAWHAIYGTSAADVTGADEEVTRLARRVVELEARIRAANDALGRFGHNALPRYYDKEREALQRIRDELMS
jgi:hypothetical protein